MRLICALVAASIFVSIGSLPAGEDSKSKERTSGATTNEAAVITTRVYKLADLPVWTKEKNFAPSVLMHLLQTSVCPEQWEGEGGRATMAPYPQNYSVVISASAELHDKIADTLTLLRRQSLNGKK